MTGTPDPKQDEIESDFQQIDRLIRALPDEKVRTALTTLLALVSDHEQRLVYLEDVEADREEGT